MTISPELIARWAAESKSDHGCIDDNTAALTRFAELVRKHSIEQCAEECDIAARYWQDEQRSEAAKRIAAVLRGWP